MDSMGFEVGRVETGGVMLADGSEFSLWLEVCGVGCLKKRWCCDWSLKGTDVLRSFWFWACRARGWWCLSWVTTWNCKLGSSVFLFIHPNGFWFEEHSLLELLSRLGSGTGYIH